MHQECSLWQSERNHRVSALGAKLAMSSSSYNDVLLAAASLISHRSSLGARRQIGPPDLPAGLDITRSLVCIHSRGDEHQATPFHACDPGQIMLVLTIIRRFQDGHRWLNRYRPGLSECRLKFGDNRSSPWPPTYLHKRALAVLPPKRLPMAPGSAKPSFFAID